MQIELFKYFSRQKVADAISAGMSALLAFFVPLVPKFVWPFVTKPVADELVDITPATLDEEETYPTGKNGQTDAPPISQSNLTPKA